ncbi:unnamed protein product, partial [Phaeothamnion confervicola]
LESLRGVWLTSPGGGRRSGDGGDAHCRGFGTSATRAVAGSGGGGLGAEQRAPPPQFEEAMARAIVALPLPSHGTMLHAEVPGPPLAAAILQLVAASQDGSGRGHRFRGSVAAAATMGSTSPMRRLSATGAETAAMAVAAAATGGAAAVSASLTAPPPFWLSWHVPGAAGSIAGAEKSPTAAAAAAASSLPLAPVLFFRHSMPGLPFVDDDCFQQLFGRLSLDGVLSAFVALASEQRVLVAAADPAALTPCCEALRALLHPFRWQHAYCPVISADLLFPQTVADFLDLPVPYLIGVPAALLPPRNELPPDVVLVELGCGTPAIVGNGGGSRGGSFGSGGGGFADGSFGRGCGGGGGFDDCCGRGGGGGGFSGGGGVGSGAVDDGIWSKTMRRASLGSTAIRGMGGSPTHEAAGRVGNCSGGRGGGGAGGGGDGNSNRLRIPRTPSVASGDAWSGSKRQLNAFFFRGLLQGPPSPHRSSAFGLPPLPPSASDRLRSRLRHALRRWPELRSPTQSAGATAALATGAEAAPTPHVASLDAAVLPVTGLQQRHSVPTAFKEAGLAAAARRLPGKTCSPSPTGDNAVAATDNGANARRAGAESDPTGFGAVALEGAHWTDLVRAAFLETWALLMRDFRMYVQPRLRAAPTTPRRRVKGAEAKAAAAAAKAAAVKAAAAAVGDAADKAAGIAAAEPASGLEAARPPPLTTLAIDDGKELAKPPTAALAAAAASAAAEPGEVSPPRIQLPAATPTDAWEGSFNEAGFLDSAEDEAAVPFLAAVVSTAFFAAFVQDVCVSLRSAGSASSDGSNAAAKAARITATTAGAVTSAQGGKHDRARG